MRFQKSFDVRRDLRGMPVKKGALACDLWRHQNEGQAFAFEVLFTEKDGEARGSVLCTVHAENLTKPETARVGSGLMELRSL